MTEGKSNLLRNILAIVAGILAGGLVIFIVQGIGHQVYPVAGDVDYNDKEAMRALMASLPAGALLFVIAAYAMGSFVAGAVAAYFGRAARVRHAVVAGCFLLLAGIMNLVAIPHPKWFSVITVLVFIPSAWLGGRLISGAGNDAGVTGQSGE